MNLKFNKWKKIALFIGIFSTFFTFSLTVNASETDNVFGSAWSNNVGWIHFNDCSNPFDKQTCNNSHSFGVKVDPATFEVSGHAWSDNVGWISFNPNEWNGNPPGMSSLPSSNKWGSGGWARATSATNGVNTGGWDGWISLGGSNYSASFNISKNIASSMPTGYQTGDYIYTINSSNNGYWWGSEVVGWIDLNPTSSSNPINGGVFMFEIANNAMVLNTPNNSNKTVLAGDKVDIHWEVTTFTPTECTGTMFDSSNNPITGRPDWLQTFSTGGKTSGDIVDIEVPYDPSNAQSIVTNFTLTCKDSVKSASQTVAVTAEPLTVFLKVANSCDATLDWFTNDPSQDCIVNATPATGGSGPYSFGVSGQSPGVVKDVDFKKNKGNGPTKYSFTCQNGTGLYQSKASATTTGTVTIDQCVADYSLNYSPSCQPFALNGTNYEATVDLSVSAFNGFNDDVSISDNGGVGVWTFSPKTIFKSPYSSQISAMLTLTSSEYNSIDWTNPFTRDIYSDSSGFPTRVKSVEFCEVGSKTIKPKYRPF